MNLMTEGRIECDQARQAWTPACASIDTTPGAKTSWLVGAWLTLITVIVATLLTSLDRNVLVLYAASVGSALELSDTQLGMLQGVGISLLASMVAIPIGWLADRYDHRAVLILCLCVWAGATVRGATTEHFTVLFACTIAMGLGDAGFSPIVYSLIPRIFSPQRRFLANSVYAIANLLGLGAGVALAAGLGSIGRALVIWSRWRTALADWQVALLVAAALAVPVVLAVSMMKVGHPGNGEAPESKSSRFGLAAYLRSNLRTLVAVYGSFGLASLGISAVSIWLPMLLGREYGVEAETAGDWMAMVYMAGIGLGALFGTLGVRLLRPRAGSATPVWTVAIGCTVGALVSAGMLVAQTPLQIYLLFGGLVTAAVSGVVLAPTMMQEMTASSMRSSVIAAGSMLSVMITSLSGPVVGLLSDGMRGHPHGLRHAVVIVGLGAFLLAAVLLTWIAPSYVRTVDANQSPQE
jgi:MFS family permease